MGWLIGAKRRPEKRISRQLLAVGGATFASAVRISLLAAALPLAGTLLFACASRPNGEALVGKPAEPRSARDPGRIVLHRLNRAEYNNSVRDLLGSELRPADQFPDDDYGFGFDNVAGALTLPPSQLQLYERAAELLAEEIVAPPTRARVAEQLEAEQLKGDVGGARYAHYNLANNGSLTATFRLPGYGRYRLTLRVYGEQAGSERVRMGLRAGGSELGPIDVPNDAGRPLTLVREVSLAPGDVPVVVSFLNDFADAKAGQDRNLLVDWLKIEGPLDGAEAEARRQRVLSCDVERGGERCASEILARFARRAFRRPVTAAELGRLLALYASSVKAGDAPLNALQLSIQAVLLSPHFVFRPELDADPASPIVRRLSGYELASRLSYFIWSSTPDDELLRAAAARELEGDSGLARQVERLLADPRALALIDNFAGQWLLSRALAEAEPDPKLFPEFDAELRASLAQETRLFLQEFLREPRPLEELLTADFSYVNPRLARHYGLADPGPGFHRVTLTGKQRGGLLRQGTILTVTSLPARSSPVKRGKWVLGQMLCAEPPPPPPGVATSFSTDKPHASLRELLAQHRANPECAVCHDVLDPIGLALESYDAIGRFRTLDNGVPVDPRGTLPDGTVVDGSDKLAHVLAADPRFAGCVARRLYTYALSRGVQAHDEAHLEGILKALGQRDFSLPELIREIALSVPFRYRRGEAPQLEGGG